MSESPTGLRLIEIDLPAGAAAPGRLLAGVAALDRVVDDHEFGNHDLAPAAGELLADMKDREFVRRRRWAVVDASDAVIGSGTLIMPHADNTHQATLGVNVLPGHRQQGIGTRIFEALAGVARADGRTVLLGQTNHARYPSPTASDKADVVQARTGAGGLFADDPTARFAHRCGFALEQTALHSVLNLPVDAAKTQALRQGAEARSDGEYSLVQWISRGPDEWMDDYAVLLGAMSTDVPSGDLDMRQEAWDAARVRGYEASLIAAGTVEYVLTAMHVPTHTLVGYTIIEVGARSDESARQCDTLVAPAHRGRRLGQLMKAANLARVQSAHPGLRRLHTWNATENVHMLAVNRDQGYVVASVGGQWQRRETATSSRMRTGAPAP